MREIEDTKKGKKKRKTWQSEKSTKYFRNFPGGICSRNSKQQTTKSLSIFPLSLLFIIIFRQSLFIIRRFMQFILKSNLSSVLTVMHVWWNRTNWTLCYYFINLIKSCGCEVPWKIHCISLKNQEHFRF